MILYFRARERSANRTAVRLSLDRELAFCWVLAHRARRWHLHLRHVQVHVSALTTPPRRATVARGLVVHKVILFNGH